MRRWRWRRRSALTASTACHRPWTRSGGSWATVPWIYHYSGAEPEEGAFLACTFWLAEAYAVLGRRTEAAALLDDTLARLPEGAGVMGEMVDVATGDFLGNLPQGLSHLALIHAAIAVEDATLVENRCGGPAAAGPG